MSVHFNLLPKLIEKNESSNSVEQRERKSFFKMRLNDVLQDSIEEEGMRLSVLCTFSVQDLGFCPSDGGIAVLGKA